MSKQHPTRCRSGITLIESLVALAIVGLLAALILPAVLAVRATAGRLECSSHLRQIGLGMQAYQETTGAFPPPNVIHGGGFQSTYWGTHVLMLPFVGEENLYDQINLSVYAHAAPKENVTAMSFTPSIYLCPSDGTPQDNVLPEYPLTAFYNYSICVGDGFAFPRDAVVTEDMTIRPRGMFNVEGGVRPAEIVDGLSRTAAFSERIHGRHEVLGPVDDPLGDPDWRPRRDTTYPITVDPPTPQRAYEACHSLPGPRGGNPTNANWFADMGYTHQSTPNGPSCWPNSPLNSLNGSLTAGSTHPGGVNVLFADGHVVFVSDAVDLEVWRAAGTRDGGETTRSL